MIQGKHCTSLGAHSVGNIERFESIFTNLGEDKRKSHVTTTLKTSKCTMKCTITMKITFKRNQYFVIKYPQKELLRFNFRFKFYALAFYFLLLFDVAHFEHIPLRFLCRRKSLQGFLKVQVGISFAKVSGLLLCFPIIFRGNNIQLWEKNAEKSILVFVLYITAENS